MGSTPYTARRFAPAATRSVKTGCPAHSKCTAWSWSNHHCPLLRYSSMQLRVRACPGRPCPQSQVCAPSRARATNDEEADLLLGVAGGERAWPHAGVRQARLGRRAVTSRSTAGRERAWRRTSRWRESRAAASTWGAPPLLGSQISDATPTPLRSVGLVISFSSTAPAGMMGTRTRRIRLEGHI
jgi:hypothetical protein